MNTKASDTIGALSLIKQTLLEQKQSGLQIADGNLGCGNGNLWGYLSMIADSELAERVRLSFLRKSPQEAFTHVEKIHREYFDKALTEGLL